MSTKKIVLIVVGAGILIAAGIGVYMYNKPHTDIAKTEPAYKLDAESLVMDFNLSSQKANEKYVNKVIEVDGTIQKIRKTKTGLWTISLHDDFQGVTCVMDSIFVTKNREAIESLKEGDVVVVKGMCDGALTDVKLSRCILISSN